MWRKWSYLFRLLALVIPHSYDDCKKWVQFLHCCHMAVWKGQSIPSCQVLMETATSNIVWKLTVRHWCLHIHSLDLRILNTPSLIDITHELTTNLKRNYTFYKIRFALVFPHVTEVYKAPRIGLEIFFECIQFWTAEHLFPITITNSRSATHQKLWPSPTYM
jgi:hypothetical protein